MKRFTILTALIAFVGCAQYSEELDKVTAPTQNQTEFFASMPECETRTYVEDNKYLRWNAGDEITVFNGNSFNSHWQFAGEDGANSGKFNEVEEGGFVTGTPLDLTANYAIYPYNENITISEAGVVSLTLPAVQAYNHTYANSFGVGANTMMAVTKNTSDNFLSFKNLCGYLKLKFYGEHVTVKSVTVKGNNGEKIAGKATVSMAYGGEPTITMGNDAIDTITIDCGEGVTLSNDSANPTTFWVVIPEITFEGGITIEVTDINDQTFSKQTTNAVPIENNLIQPMAALEVITEPAAPAIPNNEIHYTATSKITPYNKGINIFGSQITSNEWDSATGKGVITFDGEVTSIGEHAFHYCGKLTSMTIPNSVTSIGEGAFYDCESLTNVNIPDGVTSIGDDAFSGCESLTSVTIPDSVTSIGEWAFYSCKSLTSVNIPDDVTSIGNYTFGFCRSLTNVTIPNSVISIGYDAFYNCSSLTSVTIPNSVISIQADAFYGCSSLKSVTIPESVTTIGEGAFKICSSLKSVYCKATTPPNLGKDVFKYFDFGVYKIIGCDIYVPAESVSVYKNSTFLGWKEYAEYIIGYDFEKGEIVPDSPIAHANKKIWYTATAKVEPYKTDVFGANIESNEWDEATGEGVITFDGEVTTIGDDAFYLCRSLTSVTIPNSVIEIKGWAFNGCTNLTNVTIPNSVISIEEQAFNACKNITSVTIPDNVLEIGYHAFSNCSSLTSVTIGNGVIEIGYGAFSGCSLLQEFKGELKSEDGRCLIIDGVLNSFAIGCGATEYTIPDIVTSIGDLAFEGCSSLTSVTIPNTVITIGGWAFYGCNSLKTVTIPDSVTEIEYYAFRGCTSLESITIPDSVTDIGKSAFYYCSNLKSVTFGSCVRKIEMEAFAGCSSLTSVTIPDSVLKIGEAAFCNCSSLKSVTIGNGSAASIETGPFSIEYAAFANCRSLTSVYCKATTPPSLDDDVFKYYNSNDSSFYNIGCKIYVPTESVNAYKSATNWSDYANYIVGYNFENSENVEGDGGNIQNGSYTVTLNNAWQKSTSVSNPDSSLYDGVYESNSNYNVNNGVATMYIDINGYTEFSFYVRSNAESNYDYVVVSQLDKTITGSTSYSDTTLVKAHTRGNQQSGSSISNYTKVTYSNISSGTHRITIVYRKDGSQHSGADRGYVLIPKNQ